MQNNLFKQPNPLIHERSEETLTNIQSMLARIQVLHIDRQQGDKALSSRGFCPANELYIRLLLLVKDAIEHEIKKQKKN